MEAKKTYSDPILQWLYDNSCVSQTNGCVSFQYDNKDSFVQDFADFLSDLRRNSADKPDKLSMPESERVKLAYAVGALEHVGRCVKDLFEPLSKLSSALSDVYGDKDCEALMSTTFTCLACTKVVSDEIRREVEKLEQEAR